MIKQTADKSFFQNEAFQSEQVRFNIIFSILDTESPIIYTDSKHIAITQANENSPVWIWTSDEISKNKCDELCSFVSEKYLAATALEFVAKPQIAQLIADHLSKTHDKTLKRTMHLMSYECTEINENLTTDGEIRKPKAADLPTVAQFLSENNNELWQADTTPEKQQQAAEKLLAHPDFYLWANSKNTTTTMAIISHKSKTHARINLVYTDKAQRNKGYSAMLVSEMCKLIFAEQLRPMLYTDYQNPASNKSYKKAGFTERGDLFEYTLEQENIYKKFDFVSTGKIIDGEEMYCLKF